MILYFLYLSSYLHNNNVKLSIQDSSKLPLLVHDEFLGKKGSSLSNIDSSSSAYSSSSDASLSNVNPSSASLLGTADGIWELVGEAVVGSAVT